MSVFCLFSGRDHLADLGIDEKILLKGILEKYGARLSTKFTWFKILYNGGILLSVAMNVRIP
jgi:hypothetical protein